MKTGISKSVSPAIVYFQYDAILKNSKMFALRDTGLTVANMELFMLKLENKNLREYSKMQNLQRGWLNVENPDISTCDSAFIKTYSKPILNGEFFTIQKKKKQQQKFKKNNRVSDIVKQANTTPRQHKFVFITGEASICSSCQTSLLKFEEVIGMFSNFELFKKRLEDKQIEFLVADIMSLPLEELVPGELPIVLYLGHEKDQEDKAEIGIFYFDKNRFGRMVQMAINKPQTYIESVPEFMNLLNIQLNH